MRARDKITVSHHAAQRVIERVAGCESYSIRRAYAWLYDQWAASLPSCKFPKREHRVIEWQGERYMLIATNDRPRLLITVISEVMAESSRQAAKARTHRT